LRCPSAFSIGDRLKIVVKTGQKRSHVAREPDDQDSADWDRKIDQLEPENKPKPGRREQLFSGYGRAPARRSPARRTRIPT
jgi:hypothetical protein